MSMVGRVPAEPTQRQLRTPEAGAARPNSTPVDAQPPRVARLLERRPAGQIVGIGGSESARTLAQRLGLTFVRLAELDIPRDVLDIIPMEVALEQRCLPLSVDANTLRIASSNPGDVDTLHLIQFLTGKRVLVEVADPADLERALQLHYGDSVAEATFQQLGADRIEQPEASREQISALAEQRPVVRLVSQIIISALRHRASDIHQ